MKTGGEVDTPDLPAPTCGLSPREGRRTQISEVRYSIWPWLAAVFALAFLLRAAPLVYLEVREPGWHASHIEELEFYFDDVGRSLITGSGFVHSVNPRPNCTYGFKPGTPFEFEPPLYAFWIGAVYSVLGPNIFLAKVLQALMDASACLLLYVLCRRVTAGTRFDSPATALFSALLYAVYPLAIQVGMHLYYQVPMNLILIWLVLCLLSPATWRNGLETGLAVGLSALAQPVTLPLLAILPLLRIRRLMWCFCFAAAGVAAIAPWIIREYEVFHQFVPIRNGAPGTLLQGSTEAYLNMTTAEAQVAMRRDVPSASECTRAAVTNHLDHFKAAPLNYLRFLAKKFLMAWYNTEGKAKNRLCLLIQGPFLALAVLGLALPRGMWLKNRNWYLPAMVLYFCAVEMALLPLVRYTLAVMPLVMVPAGIGGAYLAQVVSRFVGKFPEGCAA